MAFGSERMFSTTARRAFLQTILEPDGRADLIAKYDAQYGPFTERLGLDADGQPPAGARFVSRTMPAGTTVRSYTSSTARVDVWCSTLFGLTGKGVQEIPVKTGWLTMTMNLRWTNGWKLTDSDQKDGPEPTDANDFGEAPQL